MATKGTAFQEITTSSRELANVQRNVRVVFDQLEDPRRQLLTAPVVQKASDYQIGENLFSEYIGPNAATFALPLPSLRGVGRCVVVWIANGGGGALAVAATGAGVTVAGAASVSLAAGVMACFASNGATKWYRVS
jgi:hypothetical protein